MAWVKLAVFVACVGAVAGYCLKRRESLRQFFEEVKFEMTKVAWPKMDMVVDSTILVMVVTIVLAIMCLCVDTVFATILKAFYRA
jgi:preprotein translocase SecE subunit